MVIFNFPLAKIVKVEFMCPKCKAMVVSDWLDVPSPNLSEDTREKSLRTEEYELICPVCGMVFNITVGASTAGGEGWIDELPEGWKVSVDYQ